jgi:hypothetical protein
MNGKSKLICPEALHTTSRGLHILYETLAIINEYKARGRRLCMGILRGSSIAHEGDTPGQYLSSRCTIYGSRTVEDRTKLTR